MLDYWVGAEEAAFCQQFVADPVKGALVYIQYGPSQPEFLNVAGAAAEGFVWSTVLGVYDDAQGAEFRKKYAAKHPGVIGLCYTGSAYDTMYILKNAWTNVDPDDFKAVADYIRTHTYRGVDGAVDLEQRIPGGAALSAADRRPQQGHGAALLPGAGRRSTRSSSPTCWPSRSSARSPGPDGCVTRRGSGSATRSGPALFACEDIHIRLGGRPILDGISLGIRAGRDPRRGRAERRRQDHAVRDPVRPLRAGAAGRVVLDGRDVTSLKLFARARLGLGRTYQSPVVPDALTVGEVFRAARQAYPPYLTRFHAEWAAEKVGLARADVGVSPARSRR